MENVHGGLLNFKTQYWTREMLRESGDIQNLKLTGSFINWLEIIVLDLFDQFSNFCKT